MKRIITTILASALFAMVSQAQTGHNYYVQDFSNQGYEPYSTINVQEGDVIRFYNGAGGTFNFEVLDQNNQPNFEVPGVPGNQQIYAVTVDANYPTYNEITVQKYEFSPTVIKTVEVIFNPSATSVDEVENQIAIYPNPVQDVLNITTNSLVKEVLVYSTDGKLVLSENNMNTVDVSSLQSGSYIVNITLENDKTITKQVLKQ